MMNPVVLLFCLLLCLQDYQLVSSCPEALIVFGDSLSDTGNLAAAFPELSPVSPYGQTYFGHPAQRDSDGRLLIDFLAQAMHLPLLTPYLGSEGSDFKHGINFAVGGATATNFTLVTPFHLTAQYGWFLEFKNHLAAAGGSSGTDIIKDGLYIISIGGNDYMYAALRLRLRVPAIMSVLVSAVVQSIHAIAENLLEGGAKHLMIFGLPSEGCSALVLTALPGFLFEYDQYGCLSTHNNIMQAHNVLLRDTVSTLRQKYPDASISFADYYGLGMDIMENPKAYGFAEENFTQACCGAGGRYNFNSAVGCGRTGMVDGKLVHVEACANPKEFVQWDGVHFTEAFNHAAAKAFLSGKFLDTNNAAGFPFNCAHLVDA